MSEMTEQERLKLKQKRIVGHKEQLFVSELQNSNNIEQEYFNSLRRGQVFPGK